MEKPIASRTMYCKRCAEKGHPFSGQKYAVFGGTSQEFFLDWATWNQRKGMTPHFIYIKKRDKKIMEIEAYCSLSGCGVIIQEHKDKPSSLFLIPARKKVIALPTLDYIHLITKWKDTGYEI